MLITSERKKEPISLNTNLPDIPITDQLRSFPHQSFTEIINKPNKLPSTHKRTHFKGIKKLKFSKHRSNTTSMKDDSFSSEIDYNKFDGTDLLPNDAMTSRTNVENDNLNSFRVLVEEDYTNYIINLKKMYPNFKLNHYRKYKHFYTQTTHSNNTITTTNNNNNNSEVPKHNYPINVDKQFYNNPNEYEIDKDILEINEPAILSSISKQYDAKVETIELNIDKILESNSLLFSNYIENNMFLSKEIDSYVNGINKKKDFKSTLHNYYLTNTSKLLLQGIKRENLCKIHSYLLQLNSIKQSMQNYHNIRSDKVKELSEERNNIKKLINKLKMNCVIKKCNIISDIEKELLEQDNKNEENLIEQFGISVLRLFNITININTITNEEDINIKSNNDINTSKYDLSKDSNEEAKKFAMNFKYPEHDFNFDNGIKFTLLYNKLDKQNSLNNILPVLDILDIIIKDNLDIVEVVERLSKIFRTFMIKVYDNIQKLNSLTSKQIAEIVANGFLIILGNYHYILSLFRKNLGLTPKFFNELTTSIKSEMNKLVKALIMTSIHEIILQHDCKLFIKEIKDIHQRCKSYFESINLEWNDIIKDINNNFILTYFDEEQNILISKLTKDNWVPCVDFDDKYQLIVNFISNISNIKNNTTLIDELTKFENEINSIETTTKISSITINGESQKVINFSLDIINFIYNSLYLYIHLTSPINQSEFIHHCCSLSLNLVIKSRDIITKASDENNDMKLTITEKEISLFYSHIIIFKYLLSFFISKQQDDLKLISLFNEVMQTCRNTIDQLLTALTETTIKEFSDLDFENYPIISSDKKYNDYTKRFTKMKKIYDIMVGCFLDEDIKKFFEPTFDGLFNKMDNIVQSKNIIEKDDQLKQFRNEMIYLKKLIKMFPLVEGDKYRKIIDNMSKNANPDKVKKKKEKVKDKEENEG
jgi:hypothetical protein